MKRILYIDYDLQVGHVNFNHIHIDALKATGADVRLILHRYMFERLPYAREEYDYIVPPCLHYREGHPIINRIVFLLTLLLIRLKSKVRSYDDVVVGYCDEISLALLPPAEGMYVFVHRTANVVGSKIKEYLCKFIARNNTFLVFNTYMGKMLEEKGISSYRVISHGCAAPFILSTQYSHPRSSECVRFRIFHPSSKLNTDFVQNILQRKSVLNFLLDNKVEIILKQCEGITCIQHPAITYLPARIDKQSYQDYFLAAHAILLSYPNTFNGQVSGISFECVANSKLMMVYEQPSLQYCRDFYNYNPIFNSPQSFIVLCTHLMTSEPRLIVTPEELMPNYNHVFGE